MRLLYFSIEHSPSHAKRDSPLKEGANGINAIPNSSINRNLFTFFLEHEDIQKTAHTIQCLHNISPIRECSYRL